MPLKIRPLTPDLLPALEDLFADGGPCSRCWCMYWRIGNDYRKRPSQANKRDFAHIVEQGPPPGLLAFLSDLPVGWCQLTPRAVLPWLDRSWRLKRTDDLPVWSISCFYIRKGHRKQGITAALIRAAVKWAKKQGALAIEAYPLDAELTPSSSGTGYLSTFLRAGFEIVARHTPPRPIVRLDLSRPVQSSPRRPAANL
jgi:GNAT superfamily N-acetyltransferase